MRRLTTRVFSVTAVGLLLTSCSRGGATPSALTTAPAPAATLSGTSIRCPARGPFDASSGYYAQFYEDYILAYVLRDVKKGVYVDVGANDPDENSVTKYFYQAGWRGINIEPNPDMLTLLKKARPEDINLGIGISDKPGFLTFYRFARFSGLSTFNRDLALQHRAKGVEFDTIPIPVSTLDEVFEQHENVKHGVTFLNVDVEGFEQYVFASVDLGHHPATVVMAEATAPETEVPSYQPWQSALFAAGYLFAMDDGLNRYYVHPSHSGLLARFVEVNYCVEMDKIAKGIKLNGYLKVKH